MAGSFVRARLNRAYLMKEWLGRWKALEDEEARSRRIKLGPRARREHRTVFEIFRARHGLFISAFSRDVTESVEQDQLFLSLFPASSTSFSTSGLSKTGILIKLFFAIRSIPGSGQGNCRGPVKGHGRDARSNGCP